MTQTTTLTTPDGPLRVTWPDGLTFAEAAARLAGNLLALEAVHHEQQIGTTARTAGTGVAVARTGAGDGADARTVARADTEGAAGVSGRGSRAL